VGGVDHVKRERGEGDEGSGALGGAILKKRRFRVFPRGRPCQKKALRRRGMGSKRGSDLTLVWEKSRGASFTHP